MGSFLKESESASTRACFVTGGRKRRRVLCDRRKEEENGSKWKGATGCVAV